jgi:drug/metabolite transporter (DMT)-like permease
MDSNRRAGLLYIVLSVTGYSLFSVWVKTLQNSGMPSLDIGLWRFGLAVPLIWLLVAINQWGRPSTIRQPIFQLLGLGLLLTANALLAFFGLERIPVSLFIILFYTYPAMVALVSLVLGERLPLIGWAALGLTLVGIALTLQPPGLGEPPISPEGIALALINAVTTTIYFVVGSRIIQPGSSLVATGWALTGALLPFLLLIPLRLMQGQPPAFVPTEPPLWVNLLGLVVISTTLANLFLNAGIQKLGAPRAAILGTIEPVLTVLWAVLLLGESMTPLRWLGGALIIASVILLQIRRSPGPG